MIYDWEARAALGPLRAVLDPQDTNGLKNLLIDCIQWKVLASHFAEAERVLDLGCGTARFARRISEQGRRYVGLDPSASMLAAARANLPAARLLRFDGQRFPIASQAFDACLVVGVWAGLTESKRRRAAKEAWRILRPGGRILVVEHAQLIAAEARSYPTETEWVGSLREAGFAVAPLLRMRRARLSRPARWLLNARTRPAVFRATLGWLADLEIRATSLSSESLLAREPYHDVLILGTRRA